MNRLLTSINGLQLANEGGLNHSICREIIHSYNPSINYTNQSIKCKSNVNFISMMLMITLYSTDVRREKVESELIFLC